MILVGKGRPGHPEGIPRESGDDPELHNELNNNEMVFPARAGMIRTSSSPRSGASSIPRESGDDPNMWGAMFWHSEYSPRERG